MSLFPKFQLPPPKKISVPPPKKIPVISPIPVVNIPSIAPVIPPIPPVLPPLSPSSGAPLIPGAPGVLVPHNPTPVYSPSELKSNPSLIPSLSDWQVQSVDRSMLPLLLPIQMIVLPPDKVPFLTPQEQANVNEYFSNHTTPHYPWVGRNSSIEVPLAVLLPKGVPVLAPPIPVTPPWGPDVCGKVLGTIFAIALVITVLLWFALHFFDRGADKFRVRKKRTAQISFLALLVYFASEFIDTGTDWMAYLLAGAMGNFDPAPCLNNTMLALNIINTVCFVAESALIVCQFCRLQRAVKIMSTPYLMNTLLAVHLGLEDIPQMACSVALDSFDIQSTWLFVNAGFTAVIVLVKIGMHLSSTILEVREERAKSRVRPYQTGAFDDTAVMDGLYQPLGEQDDIVQAIADPGLATDTSV